MVEEYGRIGNERNEGEQFNLNIPLTVWRVRKRRWRGRSAQLRSEEALCLRPVRPRHFAEQIEGGGEDMKLGLANIGGKRSFFHFPPILANPKNTKNDLFSQDFEVVFECILARNT